MRHHPPLSWGSLKKVTGPRDGGNLGCRFTPRKSGQVYVIQHCIWFMVKDNFFVSASLLCGLLGIKTCAKQTSFGLVQAAKSHLERNNPIRPARHSSELSLCFTTQLFLRMVSEISPFKNLFDTEDGLVQPPTRKELGQGLRRLGQTNITFRGPEMMGFVTSSCDV